MTLSWPEPLWCTQLRAVAPELRAATLGHIIAATGPGKITGLEIVPAADELAVHVSTSGADRVEVAFLACQALAYLWPSEGVDRHAVLRVTVDQLEAAVQPPWMLGSWRGRDGWRRYTTLRFAG